MVLLTLSVFALAGCPGGGGDENGGGRRGSGAHAKVAATLIVPELAPIPRTSSSIESFVASELSAKFEELSAAQKISGEAITVEHLSADTASELDIAGGIVIVSAGFTPPSILEFAKALDGKAHVYAFYDAEFPASSGVTAVTFDYTALGFLGGALAAQMTKAGKLAAFFDDSTNRGLSLLSGIQQGAKWTRGGASIDTAAPKELQHDKIATAVKAFYLAGGEYLLYDSAHFGDYPVIAIAGTQRRLFAFGRNIDSVVPGNCVTSYICDYRGALEALISDAAASASGEEKPGLKMFGLDSGLLGNTGFAEYRRYSTVDDTYVSAVETFKNEIISGEIKLDRPRLPHIKSPEKTG